ncbi:MAG: DUF4981 domain-containing protein [Bacteroidales bacterium]|nr:DUF4981 domain-containing protein [Bacteroidales bacterium]
MAPRLSLVALSSVLAFTLNAQNKPFMEDLPYYIENVEMYGLNQEPGRAYHIPESSISLDGRWKFLYSETPEGIPADFFRMGFNDRRWNEIPVPSNWEMQGFGEAVFRNVSTPFHPDPPYVPDDYNPTGAYRTEFRMPASWKGDKVFLRFEKVASASFVWVNGQQVGYNEGAQEPSEYDITKYVKPGSNSLAVLVLKYSDGYYLEDQDYWRLAGIFDHVTVYSTRQQRIRDWQVITDFDSSFKDSQLTLNTYVKAYDLGGTVSVSAAVSRDGKEVVRMEKKDVVLSAGEEKTVSFAATVPSPLKWTAETPELYDLEMTLKDASGATLDVIRKKMGFKKTEIRDGVFYLNGKPVKLSGVCSHMQHPDLGHAMDEATIRKDMELLKQFNFNTVRTSHYPPVNRYLELADEYGLYIVDETGDEAHATEELSERPEWAPMYRERARQMVLRDRNHACVLFWSAGNESGEGQNIAEVIDEGKSCDPTRFWMYGGNALKHPAEDIIGPRYPMPLNHELGQGFDTRDRRPSFMDEYVSVAGNGGGALDDYWREIYEHPSLMGGAIWDFVSPGIRRPVRELEDKSPNGIMAVIMGSATIGKMKGHESAVLSLNKYDQWVQVYRADALEICSDKLTLTFDVLPRENLGETNYFLTKGCNQYGIVQTDDGKLDFYIDNGEHVSLQADVPSDWMNKWHNVTGVYDGSTMELYVDGRKAASRDACGNIRNLPLSVCIGRDEQEHGQDCESPVCEACIDNVGIFEAAVRPADGFDPAKAALWLDFEKETRTGEFFFYGLGARTYGCIWPDRTPQPEMYQMKKSTQPLRFRLLDSRTGELEVLNRSCFLDASEYRTTWTLTEDSEVLASGELAIALEPGQKGFFRIPYTRPDLKPGKEYRITLSSVLRKDAIWASAGHEVAWEQFELPAWRLPSVPEAATGGAVSLERSSERITAVADGFRCSFDAVSGALVSIETGDGEMMESPLHLNLWRAPVANETDSWGSYSCSGGSYDDTKGYAAAGAYTSISGMYHVAHLDDPIFLPSHVEAFEADGSVYVDVRELVLFGGNADRRMQTLEDYLDAGGYAGFESRYLYRIDSGTITIHHQLCPEGNLPKWLPRIGLTLSLDGKYENVSWYGRGPQASYPDRKTGYRIGVYGSTVEDMYEPYLIPQDYGLRMDTRWVEFRNDSGSGLRISMDTPFAFNAYPFTTGNLTKALYPFQLQRDGELTVNLDYDTTGVGDTANGPFEAYRCTACRELERTITIKTIH